jgi:hypothetical protein
MRSLSRRGLGICDGDRWGRYIAHVSARASICAALYLSACSPRATPPPLPPVVAQPGPIGTAAPTLVQAVAPDGRWVVLCQARLDTNGDGKLEVDIGPHGDPYGDALAPYLVVGEGDGVPIDAFLDADPTGRYLAIVVHGGPVLYDTQTGAETALSSERSPMEFSVDGTRLLFSRLIGGSRTLVVRTLATGDERQYDIKPGELVAASFFSGGQAIRLLVRPDGVPVDDVHSDQYRGSCAGSAAASFTSGVTYRHEQRLLAIDDDRSRTVAEAVTSFGTGWLRTLADGSVRFESFAGDGRELVPASCKIRFADAVGMSVVAVCNDGAARSLRLFGERESLTLGPLPIDTGGIGEGDDVGRFGRHLIVSDVIINVASLRRTNVAASQQVLAIRGDRTLVQRGESLVLLDGERERTLGTIAKYPRVYGDEQRGRAEAAPFVLVDTLVVDMQRGKLAGNVPCEPPARVGSLEWPPFAYRAFGFTRDGRILVDSPPPSPVREDRGDIADGPLQWRAAVRSASCARR